MTFSINTNLGALAALQSLQDTQTALNTAQNQVSSGLAVGGAADNPAIYAISQTINDTISGLTAVSDGLSFGAQVVSTATQAVESISSTLATLQNSVTQGQSQGLSATEINTEITNQLANINGFASAATFNGVNLISGSTNSVVTSTQIKILQDTSGNSFTVGSSGVNVINATAAGLGLADLNVNTAGLSIDLTGLSASSIVNSGVTASDLGTLSDTTVTLQTSNYNVASQISATNVGQQWVFEFSNAASSVDTTDSSATTVTTASSGNIVNVEAKDANGNITQQTNVIKVVLGANFTTSDAINALQSALTANGFSANLSGTGLLTVAGNNINATSGPNGTVAGSASVSNLAYTLASASAAAGSSFVLNSVAGLVVGQQVQAQGSASGANSLTSTYITAIDTNTNTITTAGAATGTLAASTNFAFGPVVSGTAAQASEAGSDTIQLSSVSGLQIGQTVADSTTGNTTAITSPTVITGINATNNTITLSNVTAATVNEADTLTFGVPQYLAGNAAAATSTTLVLTSTSGLSVGDSLTTIGTTGTGAATTAVTGTTITKIDGDTVTLSQAVGTAVSANNYLTFGPTAIAQSTATAANVTSNNAFQNTIALANVTGVKVGQLVSDATTAGAVTTGTYVTAVNAVNNTITLSQSLAATLGGTDSISFTDVPPPQSPLVNQTTGSTVVLQAITAAISKVNAISTTLGSASQEITGLQSYSSSLSDSLTAGVGALTDADLAAESAKLTSLQTKESLAIQALSIANSRPQALLTLFR
jgi:flagellin